MRNKKKLRVAKYFWLLECVCVSRERKNIFIYREKNVKHQTDLLIKRATFSWYIDFPWVYVFF